jgi:hypothetical protein
MYKFVCFRGIIALSEQGVFVDALLYAMFRVASVAQSVRAGRSGDRIPVRARFSLPVQTGPGAHPTSCTVDAGSFSQGVKWPECGVYHLCSAMVKD